MERFGVVRDAQAFDPLASELTGFRPLDGDGNPILISAPWPAEPDAFILWALRNDVALWCPGIDELRNAAAEHVDAVRAAAQARGNPHLRPTKTTDADFRRAALNAAWQAEHTESAALAAGRPRSH